MLAKPYLSTFLRIYLIISWVVMSAGCSQWDRSHLSNASIPKLEKPHFKIPVGERMVFSIRWLGMEVGTAAVKVEEIVKMNERDAYHVSVHVRSNKFIDLFYPVRDEHHSYIDVEHLYSLRYERKMKQRDYRADELITFDQVNHKGLYESKRSGDTKEMIIPENVQDPVSCTYWFRMQPLEPGTVIHIPVNVDEKNWTLEVHVEDFEQVVVDGFGQMVAIRTEPIFKFQGLFMSRGRVWGWMGTDERRTPLVMKTKIKILGAINVVIKEYEAGDYHVEA